MQGLLGDLDAVSVSDHPTLAYLDTSAPASMEGGIWSHGQTGACLCEYLCGSSQYSLSCVCTRVLFGAALCVAVSLLLSILYGRNEVSETLTLTPSITGKHFYN